jgi:YD repeat-containing protein
MKCFLLAALVILSIPAYAVVDMKNANYAESFVDITMPGTGIDFKVQRYYNSRSIFSGFFGYGWCSDYETSIEKTPEGGLKLQECGAGQEVTYRLGKSNEVGLESTVSAILKYAKETNHSATPQYLEGLKNELLSNPGLRVRWAKEAKLKIPEIKKGSTYVADTLEVETIVFDGTNYTRTLADGTSQKFDGAGHLIFIYDKNQNYVKISYVNDQIKEVTDNAGRRLTFSFYPNRRVHQIIGPGNIRAEYKFKGEDLVEVQNMWKNTYTFLYDDVHNLTRVNFPDKTFKALTYNKNMDWVMSFTDRVIEGVSCTENYAYEMDKQNPHDHYWATAIKKCGKEVKNEARFEFWHKRRADGSKYLARVLTKSSNDSLDVTYHPELGRPTQIKKNGQVTTFGYYPSGLIQWKSTEAAKLNFEYKNKFNKVSRVVTEYFDNAKKASRKRETDFNYDNKANLVSAANSDGQTVNMTYDLRGRIASITDQAKKEVLIQYDEKTGKPSIITRPKLGTIKVTYKANGEIDKVDSKDGPTVAVQVASTFNNLLDIISPATSELNM